MSSLLALPFGPVIVLLVFAVLVGGGLVVWLSRRTGRRVPVDAVPADTSGPAHTSGPLTRLGPYTLEEKIGEGGMGEVYRGRHERLRRPTAIKTLRVEAADEEGITRFEQEVQLTANLRHPNTVAVYDYGRTPEGYFYYAMEYLTGAPIDTVIRATGPFDEGRTIHVLRQLCGSLSEAHGIRLIHRDIKPSNLLLCVRGGVYDWLKVVDFGLVKEVGSDIDAKLDETEHITGTPLYMAPEALIPSFRHDGRQDIYAVGAIGYYMLAGSHVFNADKEIDVLRQHLRATPEPLSERVGRPVESTLERLLLQCLEKKPDARPPTAGALLHALEECPDAGAWTPEAAQHWWILNEGKLSLPELVQHAESNSAFYAIRGGPPSA